MRRPFATAAVFSLVMAAATVALGVASYRTMVSLGQFRHGEVRWELVCFRGILVVDNQPQQLLEERNILAVQNLYERSRQRLADLESKIDRLRMQTPGLLKLDDSTQGIVEAIGVEKAEQARLAGQLAGLKRRQRVTYSLDASVVLSACGIIPAVWVLRHLIRRRRIRFNHCVVCDYDLTANTSGICPECGSAVPSSAVNEPINDPSVPAASGRP